MEASYYFIGLSSIVILGIAAQLLAWWLRLPAILLLLLIGCAAGPGSEWLLGERLLDPDKLLGGLLLPLVSLSVALILFEGGLTLNLGELRRAGGVSIHLGPGGAFVTWALATLGAWALLDLSPRLSLLFGAILVVTGPTVIGPLLRHVRPTGPVGAILKWEGIVIDPIGALLAVLVFEAMPIGPFGTATTVVVMGVVKTAVLGSLIGLGGAAVFVLLMRGHRIPDYLENSLSLALVVGTFALASLLTAEAGLFAATVMGIALANQRLVSVRHILEFKESLSVLLVSCLFIILGGRVVLVNLAKLDWRILLFLVFLVLVVRPAAVAAATWKARLDWREKVFLACMAPRGIVAAAVASVFAIRLNLEHPGSASTLVPNTFGVIVGTVAIYGMAAGWAARKLGLSSPGRAGFLIAGANPLARAIGGALSKEGLAVLLVDTNWEKLQAARLDGLPTLYASIVSPSVRERIELTDLGRLLALTPNDTVNSLAVVHFGRFFGRAEAYQLAPDTGGGRRGGDVSQELRGRVLFGADATYRELASRLEQGAAIAKTKLSREFDYKSFQAMHGQAAVPLFVLSETGYLRVLTADQTVTARAGDTIISLMRKPEGAAPAAPNGAAALAG